MTTSNGGALGGAVISDCGLYRYQLTRVWGEGLFDGRGAVAWLMLNPSTADAAEDDPTIRRCVGFTRSWGFDRLTVVNLFAYRATQPKVLATVDDPVGPENDGHILGVCMSHDLVIAAWGAQGGYLERDVAVRRLLDEHDVQLHHLGLTGGGRPRHPLYLAKTLRPSTWPLEEAPT